MLIRAYSLSFAVILLLASAAANLTDWRATFEQPAMMLASGGITLSAFASYALETELRSLPQGWHLVLYVDGVLQHASRSARLVHSFDTPETESLWIHAEVCIEDTHSARIACSSSAFFSVSQRDLPDDASHDWKLDAITGRDDMHLGTLGLHAVLALPAAVIHMFTAMEHMGCFIVVAACDGWRLCFVGSASMEGAHWSVHQTGVSLSSAWIANAFSTAESANVWLHDPTVDSARPHLISVYVENRSVVYIGGADLIQSHDDRFTLLSCNSNPSICVFLSSSADVSIDNSLPIRALSCNVPNQAQACETTVLHVPFHAAESSEIVLSSILRDNSLASASVHVSAGDTIYFTIFYWLSGAIAATPFARLLVDVSQVKAAFMCGQFSCTLAANGLIIVQNGTSSVKQSRVAVHAANEAFTTDPRCEVPSGKRDGPAQSLDFAVESAWIGDQELVIHWGAGCFTAIEWTHSCNENNCFVASWAACVGSDIIRASPHSPIPTSFYSMVVPVTAQETANACHSDRAVPVMKWWALPRNVSCSLHERLPLPSHPQAAKLFDQLVDVSYNNSRWTTDRVMVMVTTVPWRRSSPQSKVALSRAQMQLRSSFAVETDRHSEAPTPVCFLTGLSAFVLEKFMCFECFDERFDDVTTRVFCITAMCCAVCCCVLLLPAVPSHIRYPSHAGMFLEQHFLRTLQLNAASLNNCNFVEVDWLAREHEMHYGLCKSVAVFESLIKEMPHEAVAFIQMDDHPSTRGWEFPASWTVFSAGGFSASHVDIPLVTERPSLARRMSRRLQQQLAHSTLAQTRRPLDLFYMGRNTHFIRRLSSLQWSVLGPFPRSMHVNVMQPISVEATVAHHALLQSSKYSLAPRGNGGSSFRICEAISAGSIPVYIWNNTIQQGAVRPQLNRPFSDFALHFSSRYLPLLPSVLDCISDSHFHALIEAGRDVEHEFTVAGVMQRVFSALNARVVPRKLLSRSDGLLDILQRALEDGAARLSHAPLCRRSDVRVGISLAYILHIANVEAAFGCGRETESKSCGMGPSRDQLQRLLFTLQSSLHDADSLAGKLSAFSSTTAEVNSTASFCDALLVFMQPLLQCSTLNAELLSRASFVLRSCRAPLSVWTGLVQRAHQLCKPDARSSEFEHGERVFECSASTAVRVASENSALKLELFKQQTSVSKGHHQGTRYVHIVGTSTSALLLQTYRDSLRAQGIEHVDAPMRGSCLVVVTHVLTMVYAPFIALSTENDHELLLAQGLLSSDTWSLIKAACMYIDVVDNISPTESTQGAPCHDVILRFASDYDLIICDAALVVDV